MSELPGPVSEVLDEILQADWKGLYNVLTMNREDLEQWWLEHSEKDLDNE